MDVYQLAKEYALHTNRCMYITGKAGTGKTTFLRQLRNECNKQMAVVAATGVAAINAEGVTIHSFFQLPPQTFLPTPAARRQLFAEMQMRAAKRNVLRNLELLVIDEISMVRADLLDTIDAVLRQIKHYPQLPFGGVQVIFIGDLFQLSPVVRDEDWAQLRNYYAGPYFFQSHVMQEIQPVYLEFDHIFRQQNEEFIRILNEVRDNTLSTASLHLLNSRYQPHYTPSDDDFHIILSTHNHKVNTINDKEIAHLTTPSFSYEAHVEGAFPESAYPTEETLQLKVGARVMFIKNDTRPEKAFYNGKLGIVTKLDKRSIWVDTEEEEIEVPLAEWENVRYVPNAKKETVETEVIGRFTQFPLRLAWAVTIHKAQGLTFDKVVIDAADAFAAGQVYVALSRCRTLEGIVLLTPIPNRALGGDPAVITYTQHQPNVATMANQLTSSQQAYLVSLLCQVFNFREAYHQIERLQTIIQTTKVLAEQAGEFVSEQLTQMVELQRIGEQFQQQLRRITTGEANNDYLKQRLQSAYQYFSPRIMAIIEAWQALEIEIGDKEQKRDYHEIVTTLLVGLSLTEHLMKHLQVAPTQQAYFTARTSFVAPKLQLLVGEQKASVNAKDCQHPNLLKRLTFLRRTLATDADVPAYTLARNSSLIEMANKLPTTKKQLLDIAAFGKKKYDIWGEEILQIIRKYCQENDLPIAVDKPAKRKAQRGDTLLTTLQLFEQGFTIADIAHQRGLTPSTIAGHICKLIQERILTFNDLPAQDRYLVEEHNEQYFSSK